jgi:hypothetical protein
MISETHIFEVQNGADLILDSSNVNGQRFQDGNRNAQLQVSNLGGGTFTVAYRYVRGTQFTNHVENATEIDSVVLAGDRAPIFEALKISFNNVPNATTQIVTLTTWIRGL